MQVLRQFIERLTARATFPVLVAAMLAAFGLGSVGVSNAVAAVMAALITVTVTVVTVVYTATTTVTAVVYVYPNATSTNYSPIFVDDIKTVTVTTTLPPGDALTFVTTTETVTGESTAIVFDTVTLQQGVATAYTVIVTGTQTETETLTVDGPPLETHATTTTTTTTETTKTNTDNDDKKRKLTPAEKLKKERTNDSNPDDYWTEGGYRSVERTAEGLVFVIDTKDPPLFQQRVVFACGSNCPTVPSTGYLLAKGVKQSEVLFEAEDIAID